MAYKIKNKNFKNLLPYTNSTDTTPIFRNNLKIKEKTIQCHLVLHKNQKGQGQRKRISNIVSVSVSVSWAI